MNVHEGNVEEPLKGLETRFHNLHEVGNELQVIARISMDVGYSVVLHGHQALGQEREKNSEALPLQVSSNKKTN